MTEERDDPLSRALNINPLSGTDAVKDMVAHAHDDSAATDFELARANIHGIIENGNFAMQKLAQIADSSQHPRAFEVLSTLMKTMLDANKDLLEIQKRVREIQEADQPHSEQAKTVTNNLFVGSTAELQKAIENMKNGSK